MKNTIICPNCHEEIEISHAIEHELSEKLKLSIEKKFNQRLEEERRKALEKAKKTASLELKDKENENRELEERNEKLHRQILEMNKTLRLIQRQSRDKELEMQRQLLKEREKIEKDITQKITEDQRLKDKEKDEKIKSLLVHIEDLKRRASQGSQQSQGEALELDLDEELKKNFPKDEIKEVKKGARGADIIQIVKTPMGREAGKIVWETKRTKNWENKWIEKLKNDQREEGAELAVIITQTMPKKSKKEIEYIDKVWVSLYTHAVSLANLLREQLLSVAKQKAITSKSQSDAQSLFEYLTGHEFAHQMEAIIEVYLGLNEQITREKMMFEKQWKQRETQLTKMYKSVLRIAGSITGIAGQNIPQIKGIDILELEEGSIDDKEEK